MAQAMSKVEAVRLAKEHRGEASAQEIAVFIERNYGLSIPPAIVTVLLASLREREALEQSKRKALELIEKFLTEEPRREEGFRRWVRPTS
jgi:hypothetical protein